MKKNLLSLSIGAAVAGLTLAGAANAAVSISGTGPLSANTFTATTAGATLELNPGGIGHIGVIPYFSTQNGNQTLFSITNSDTVNGKAVKVRFRSAANSDDIFDFTLFLSPGDIWTANISRDPTTGTSRLVTTDNSCTLPGIAALNRGFVDARLPAGFTAAQKAEWTREGYVEVLTMADIPPTAGTAAAPDLYYATKHVGGVAPCTDSVLSKLTVPANFADEASARALGFDTPSTGLYTNAFIINTANAFLSWSNESTAVQAVTAATGVAARGRFVFAAQTNDAVQTTAANLLTADPLLVGGFSTNGGVVAATVPPLEFDFPDLSTPYTGTAPLATTGTGSPAAQATRLSGSLATTSVKNDYSTLAAIGSKTDFTFSLPTRRYHAVVSYVGAPNGIGGGAPVAGPIAVYSTAPTFTGRTFFIASNTSLQGNLLCVNTGSAAPVTAFDRSERTVTTGNGAVVSPGTGTAPLSFCGEVSVLTINGNASNPAGNGVLGAAVAAKDVFTSYQEGWLTIATPGPFVDAGNAGGLPVLGSAYTSAIGSPANGVSTNYSWAFKHKTTPSLVANP
ncbi:cell surface protein [Xylophilus sp. Leaf220]|uniref:cell surface protein n=1 Tax=Xylophilus sp. Leaf220 TaxID=1735686 RepID=UPI000AE31137|nr:cell surface protein [Xylophilus sp. Leaf220]